MEEQHRLEMAKSTNLSQKVISDIAKYDSQLYDRRWYRER